MIIENKIKNRIIDLFKAKDKILSVYFTAGYPNLNDMEKIILSLQNHGVDMIEIGIPFSDSLMDGPVIQHANNVALENGMTMDLLFQQLEKIKGKIKVPILLMGSLNPIYQFGFERFCKMCKSIGIDGTIIPEMPLKEYIKNYKYLYSENNLSNIFMITPQTSEEKIKLIDENSEGFIYMISSNSTTGNAKSIDQGVEYFKRVENMNLINPRLIGFNINEKFDFDIASQYSNGAIVGTAFIKAISDGVDDERIGKFLNGFRNL